MGGGSGHLPDSGMVTVASCGLECRDGGGDVWRRGAAVTFDGALVEEGGRRHDVGRHGQLVVVMAVVAEHGGRRGGGSGGVAPGGVGAGARVRGQLRRDGRGGELVSRGRESGWIPGRGVSGRFEGQFPLSRVTLQVTHDTEAEGILEIHAFHGDQVPGAFGCTLTESDPVIIRGKLVRIKREGIKSCGRQREAGGNNRETDGNRYRIMK